MRGCKIYTLKSIIGLFLFLNISCSKENNSGSSENLPIPASNLEATKSVPGVVKLTWIDNSTNEQGFTIERKSTNSTYSVIAKVGINISSYEDKSTQELTSYTYRVYPYNRAGISPTYSNEATIMTYGTLLDIDGNRYTTARIGNRIWTLENYRVGKYRNGNSIPQSLSKADWIAQPSGAFTYLDDNPANNDKYGKLYNYHAIRDNRGFAPPGWHVMNNNDWVDLKNTIAAINTNGIGGHLKQKGTRESGDGLWKSPNRGATNLVGFNALPGSGRNGLGNFLSQEGEDTHFAVINPSGNGFLILYHLIDQANDQFVNGNIESKMGVSVRLVKD